MHMPGQKHTSTVAGSQRPYCAGAFKDVFGGPLRQGRHSRMYAQQRCSLTVQRSKLARPVFSAVGAAAFDWQHDSQGRPGATATADATAAASVAACGTGLEQLLRVRLVVLGCVAVSMHASTPLLQESAVASCPQPQQLPPASTACQRPANDAHTQHQACLHLKQIENSCSAAGQQRT